MKNNFFEIIKDAKNSIPENQDLASDFLSIMPNKKYYVIGKNEDSKKLIQSFKISGVVDDFAELDSNWQSVPIVKSSDVSKGGVVINCSTSISPLKVQRVLKSSGVENILNLNELIFAGNGIISTPLFVQEMNSDFNENSKEWFRIYNLLEDDESKDLLLNIICFRITGDIKYMEGNTVRLNQQYFEDFMDYNSETFVDIGGYDGDTTEVFCKLYPNYNKVLLFEPSLINMEAAKKRLSKFERIEFFNYGLSDKNETLSFSQDNGSSSSISTYGNVNIEVTTLDEIVKEPVSVIKMDIEGWEMKALKGCSNHIKADKPKLALAVYHNAKDFHEIPNFILSLNPEYKIYLRHYTEGWSETVMFFMPRKN